MSGLALPNSATASSNANRKSDAAAMTSSARTLTAEMSRADAITECLTQRRKDAKTQRTVAIQCLRIEQSGEAFRSDRCWRLCCAEPLRLCVFALYFKSLV